MTPEELLAGVLEGDEHAGGTRCLRLHEVEPDFLARLGADVDRLISRHRPSDVSDPRHVTNWVRPVGTVEQYSLLNTSGRFDDFSDDHDIFGRRKGFAHARDYPTVAFFMLLFPDAVNFRLNAMGPSSGLSPHEEHVLTYAPDGSVVAKLRFHLPLHTSPEATLVLDDHVFTLDSGVVHFVNHGCVHAATNAGPEHRTHLVWDMLFTRQTFDLMFGAADPPAPLRRVPQNRRSPAPVRKQRQGSVRRLPALVTAQDRRRVALAMPGPGWPGYKEAHSSTPEKLCDT
jgi:Aspartyl/Asparaginyl beta-hydroxylase